MWAWQYRCPKSCCPNDLSCAVALVLMCRLKPKAGENLATGKVVTNRSVQLNNPQKFVLLLRPYGLIPQWCIRSLR